MPAPPIRLLIADDHAIIRVGLSSMLANEKDVEIVGVAENGLEAIELYKKHLPDIVLLDVRMPKLDGIGALKQLRGDFPDVKALMLSTAELEDEVALAAEAGASGYLTKSMEPGVLAVSLRKIMAGEKLFSKRVIRRLEERKNLSPRELQVLSGMASGHTNKQIADELDLSEHTVKTYAKGILSKLHAEDRAGAVASAFAKGILKV